MTYGRRGEYPTFRATFLEARLADICILAAPVGCVMGQRDRDLGKMGADMTDGARFSWLHFSDIHVGMKQFSYLWHNVEETVVEDLTQLHKRTGPWDAILFTGDLAQKGLKDEFKKFDEILSGMRTTLRKLGSDPLFLAVPGNHDLERPNPDLSPVRSLSTHWKDDAHLRKLFWTEDDLDYRQVAVEAFSSWSDWAKEGIDRRNPF